MKRYKIFFDIDDALYYSNRLKHIDRFGDDCGWNPSEDAGSAYLENYKRQTEDTDMRKFKILPEIVS
ncbi:MAG: hypothetical protein L6266_01190 [Nanoarchaeota archaeon]|nr:hypothetical protein [Nanoarchaeota archaeon]